MLVLRLKKIFSKNHLYKFKKLSNFTFLIGIFIFISFPIWQENYYINDKQLKGSDEYNIEFKESIFRDSFKILKKFKESYSFIANKGDIPESYDDKYYLDELKFINYLKKVLTKNIYSKKFNIIDVKFDGKFKIDFSSSFNKTSLD